jgi:hypothetical protein
LEDATAMENRVAVDLVMGAIGLPQAADMVVHAVNHVLKAGTLPHIAILIVIQFAHGVQVVLQVIT